MSTSILPTAVSNFKPNATVGIGAALGSWAGASVIVIGYENVIKPMIRGGTAAIDGAADILGDS